MHIQPKFYKIFPLCLTFLCFMLHSAPLRGETTPR